MHADFKACDDYAQGTERAARVRCPTLFLLGDRDTMTPPKAARALQSAIKGQRTVLVRASGHALMAEQPDAVLDALVDFLR